MQINCYHLTVSIIICTIFLLFNHSILNSSAISDDITYKYIITNSTNIFEKSEFDKFGIKKIYPTLENGFEWYINMHNAELDPYLHNYGEINKNSDSSYNIGTRSRMSVYSKDGIGYTQGNMQSYNFTFLSTQGYWYKSTDWKNVEITGEYLLQSKKGNGITHYARSEDHSVINNGCGGSSYKHKIYFDGTSSLNKELVHPKAWKNPKTSHAFGDLKDKWFRFKSIMYNLEDGTVKLENWLDPYLNNTWIKIAEDHDSGGWGKDGKKCYGKEDQIITWGSPIVTFRWDDTSINFKNLSVREITNKL
jgi:hypothetical protein